MPLTLGPLVDSNSSLLDRDVTYTPHKGPSVLVGNILAYWGNQPGTFPLSTRRPCA